jgi:hypothetical protein
MLFSRSFFRGQVGWLTLETSSEFHVPIASAIDCHVTWRTKSKPLAVNSRLKTYFPSMRIRTASAACRSVSPSPYCMRVTRARRQGASAPCPRLLNRSAKSSSSYSFPDSSRMRIHALPLGRTACAMRTVSSGIAGIGWGCIDIGSLLVSLTLSFFISISYVSPILLWQFANNIREREYQLPLEWVQRLCRFCQYGPPGRGSDSSCTHHRTGEASFDHGPVGSTRFLHGNVGGAAVTADDPSGLPDALRTNLLQWVAIIREASFVVCHSHHASAQWLRRTKAHDNMTY